MDDKKSLLDKVEEIRIPEAPSDKTLIVFAAALLGIGVILFFFWIWFTGHGQ